MSNNICQYCGNKINETDDLKVCLDCAKMYHQECWDVMGGCTNHNSQKSEQATQTVCSHTDEQSGSNDMFFCTNCGNKVNRNEFACPNCGFRVLDGTRVNSSYSAFSSEYIGANDAYRKLAEYENISGIVWLVIGIVQCLTGVGIICGIWNIVASKKRINYSKELETMPSGVYDTYKNRKNSIIVMLVLNLCFGALIGIVGAIFDLFVRNYVMDHADIFGVNFQTNQETYNSEYFYQPITNPNVTAETEMNK